MFQYSVFVGINLKFNDQCTDVNTIKNILVTVWQAPLQENAMRRGRLPLPANFVTMSAFTPKFLYALQRVITLISSGFISAKLISPTSMSLLLVPVRPS
jgi:hypothetical protein